MKDFLSNQNPIITVKEARKILGACSQELTDIDIEKLINELDFLAKIFLLVK